MNLKAVTPMNIRPLIIDDVAKATAQKVVEYARVHPYYLPSDGIMPGDNPGHVCALDTYRCVFTFTHVDKKVWRHLSISIPGRDYPNPFSVWTITELFGFTGWDGKSFDRPDSWLVDINKQEHCIVVVQEYLGT